MNTACMRLPLCCRHCQCAVIPAARSCIARHLKTVRVADPTNLVATWRSHRWSAVKTSWRACAQPGISPRDPDDSRLDVAESSGLANELETVSVYFGSDDVYTTARPGDNLWAVASKAGIVIPTSCNSGSCGTCEMEVRKWDKAGVEGGTSIARTCIAAVPPGYPRLQLDAMDDGIWGADGFDM